MSWHSADGNLILIFDRSGGPASPPIQFQTDACWMWHSINAYDDRNVIVADFIGYENPDHILGERPALTEIMEGRRGTFRYPGEVQRYIIELESSRVHQEKIVTGSYEFPWVNPHHICHPNRFAYCAVKLQKSLFYSGIAMVDFKAHSAKVFDFGQSQFCGEPVFVPEPGYRYDPSSAQEPGWLLVEVYNSLTRHKYLAVFHTKSLVDGPMTVVHIDRYLPFGLHGFWRPA
jgi:all-trans-8'-apo-beta-carotenal 15,15'-oxygenase